MMFTLLFAGLASAGNAIVTDHAVGTPLVKKNLAGAGFFGATVAVDNNSDYTMTATVEGVTVVVPAHNGKQFSFDRHYATLDAHIEYTDGDYVWNKDVTMYDDTALEVYFSSFLNDDPDYPLFDVFVTNL